MCTRTRPCESCSGPTDESYGSRVQGASLVGEDRETKDRKLIGREEDKHTLFPYASLQATLQPIERHHLEVLRKHRLICVERESACVRVTEGFGRNRCWNPPPYVPAYTANLLPCMRATCMVRERERGDFLAHDDVPLRRYG